MNRIQESVIAKQNINNPLLFKLQIRIGRFCEIIGLGCYLIFPSIAWSMVYRSPKIVADPLLLMAIEALAPTSYRAILRFLWGGICTAMLLLEWNIFPESYLFYLSLLWSITAESHGRSIFLAALALIVFLFIPLPPVARRRSVAIGAVLLYALVVALKIAPPTREVLAWIRVPALRAAQVMYTDHDRFLSSSVLGSASEPRPLGHYLQTRLSVAASPPHKVVIVVLESWGETKAGLQEVVRAINRPPLRIVASGFSAYRGSTLPGEFRELCGVSFDFEKPESQIKGCLPRHLRARGFSSAAFHGYDGFFYSRDIVYRAMGFDQVRFRGDLSGALCEGAFPGACDDSVASGLLDWVQQPGQRLGYMMSLTAHAPVASGSLMRTYVVDSFSISRGLTDGQRLNRALINYVLAEALRRRLSNVGLYFVGDHNPPDEQDRSGFPEHQVPFIYVEIR